MKGLDTSVLLALLDGDRRVRELLRRLRGVEFASTEASMLELGYLASRGSARGWRHRLDALERLRRKVTVLPIDARAMDQALRHLEARSPPAPPLVLAMLGAFEAAGCDEVFTRTRLGAPGRWSFPIQST